MPQMNPTLWLPLFLTFTITLLLINPLIFFSKNFSIESSKLSSTFKHVNWKW